MGQPAVGFSIATDESFTDKEGHKQERVEWHTIVAWQRLAEIVGEFVVTGAKVYIEGKLQTSSWQDRETGQTKYRTEIVARDLVLFGSRSNGTGDVRESHPDPAERHETSTENAGDLEDIPF